MEVKVRRKKKRVLFVIATLGHGRGGHFWDLKTIVESLAPHLDCVVVNIGKGRSSVVDSIGVKVYNIKFNGFNILSVIYKFSALARKRRVQVINLFDVRVFGVVAIVSKLLKIPLILTKCGGPNPQGKYPKVSHQILFSQENLRYFERCESSKSATKYFFPNRVKASKCDPTLVDEIVSGTESNTKRFMLIARFCEAYADSMYKAIKLIRWLEAKGYRSELIIIGVPEDLGVFQRVNEQIAGVGRIFKDDRYTRDAKLCIDAADFVLSAGRGVMEAYSLGKPVLTTLKDKDSMALITKENFNDVFYSNFSPRNAIENFSESENKRFIIRAIIDNNYYRELSEFSLSAFKEYFDVENIVEDYVAMFRNITGSDRLQLSGICFYLLRSMKIFYKKSVY